MTTTTKARRVNHWEPVAAFQTFGGLHLGTLDAFDALDDDDRAALERILRRVADHAGELADELDRKETIQADKLAFDFRRVASSFSQAAANYRLD